MRTGRIAGAAVALLLGTMLCAALADSAHADETLSRQQGRDLVPYKSDWDLASTERLTQQTAPGFQELGAAETPQFVQDGCNWCPPRSYCCCRSRAPNEWTWITSALVVGGGIALLAGADVDDAESVGDWMQVGLPILAAGGIVANRDWKGGIQFAKSGVLTGLLVFGGKNLVDKWRPNASNPKSFPSGHTAMAFFGASYIYTRYGAKWGIPAYLAAMYVGASRIHAEKHFADDVLAGASIGMMANWLFVTPVGEECCVVKRGPCKQARYYFEFGFMDVRKLDVTAPRDSGTKVDFTQFDNVQPTMMARAGLEFFPAPRHEVAIEIAPNEIDDYGTTTSPISFGGQTFAAGEDVRTRILLHDYRIRYRYDVFGDCDCRDPECGGFLKAGGALALIDSEIEIRSESTDVRARVSDPGFMGTLHFHGGYRFDKRWRVFAEADLSYGGGYQQYDGSVFLEWQINRDWDVSLGVRGGVGEVDISTYESEWEAGTIVLRFGKSFYPRVSR